MAPVRVSRSKPTHGKEIRNEFQQAISIDSTGGRGGRAFSLGARRLRRPSARSHSTNVTDVGDPDHLATGQATLTVRGTEPGTYRPILDSCLHPDSDMPGPDAGPDLSDRAVAQRCISPQRQGVLLRLTFTPSADGSGGASGSVAIKGQPWSIGQPPLYYQRVLPRRRLLQCGSRWGQSTGKSVTVFHGRAGGDLLQRPGDRQLWRRQRGGRD